MGVLSQARPARASRPGRGGGEVAAATAAPGPAWAAVALLIAAGLLVYSNTLHNPFVYDDSFSITDNPNLRHLWPPGQALTGPPGSGTSGRPLVALSLALDYAVGGLDVLGYHLVNISLHVLAGCLLFGLTRRALRSPRLGARFAGVADALALVVALLWLVHPLHTAALDHVVYRNEVMMGLFYLATLYCVVRGAEAPGGARLWYTLAIIACLAGMASKEVMASAPLVVLLFDRIFLSGSWRQAWRARRGLYLGLAATWLLLAVLVRSGNRGAAVSLHLEDVTPLDYARTQFGVVLHYLKLVFWPDPLLLDYYLPVHKRLLPVAPEALGIALLAAATLWALCRRPALGFLGAWFFLILAPSSSLVPLTGAMAAEHRMYLPAAAPIVLAVIAAYGALRALGDRFAWRPQVRRTIAIGLALAVAAPLGARTLRRNADFHSEMTLWSGVLAHDPNNPRAHNNLGALLAVAGRIAEARPHYAEALRIAPDYPGAHNNLGSALVQEGKLDEAVVEFEAAVRAEPGFADAHRNLASVLIRQGKLSAAREHLQRALQAEPQNAMTRLNLGEIDLLQGKPAEGIASMYEALRMRPDLLEARDHLALALMKQARYGEAIDAFRATLRLWPKHEAALNNLAWLLATCPEDRLRSGPEAVQFAEQAAQAGSKPTSEVLDTLAAAYAEAGRFDEALRTVERARVAATAAGNAAAVQKLAARADLYRAHRAYRMPAPRS